MTLPPIRQDGDGFVATFGQEWLQGRTAYGGASAALALAAAKATFPGLPPLRSVQIAFVGPLSGEVRMTPVLLRRGKNSAFVACDVTGSDGVGLRALLLFMASRDSTISYADLAVPAHDLPETDPVDPAKLPQGFLQNFDLAGGAKREAGFLRWARLREREGVDPEVELLAVADGLPPAAMALAEEWGPISTTTWQINFVTDTPTTHDGWWLLGDNTLHAGHGSSSQNMTIWNRDGDAVATATQNVALFV